jgi:hypothetical protein
MRVVKAAMPRRAARTVRRRRASPTQRPIERVDEPRCQRFVVQLAGISSEVNLISS